MDSTRSFNPKQWDNRNSRQDTQPTEATSNLPKTTSRTSSLTSGSLEKLPEPSEMEALVAEELNQLSIDEREQAFWDVHCIKSNLPDEKPKKINDAIAKVQEEIESLDPSLKVALEQARKQGPGLLGDLKLLMRFLRAAQYDPHDCVHRLVSYFEAKKRLFGEDKLSLELKLGDLDEDDKKCLESGIMQVLPCRDQGGRAIFFWNMMLRGSHSQISKQRVQFYGLQAGSETDSVQQRGMVVVSCNFGPGKMPVSEMEMAFQNPALVAMHQVRCEAFHFCVDAEDSGRISSAIMKLVGQHTRLRFRTHNGEVTQIRASLCTFGIPGDVFPVADDGTFLLENLGAWISRRKIIEGSSVDPAKDANTLLHDKIPAKKIEVPSEWDIVCGKGKNIQELKGNVRFRNIIKGFFEKYESLESPHEKTCLALELVQNIKEKGGRFIRQAKNEPGGWKEVDLHIAREKVASAFHSLRRSNKKKRQISMAAMPRQIPPCQNERATPSPPSSIDNSSQLGLSRGTGLPHPQFIASNIAMNNIRSNRHHQLNSIPAQARQSQLDLGIPNLLQQVTKTDRF